MKLKVYKAIALIAVCLAGHTAIAQAPVNAAAQAGSAAQPTTARSTTRGCSHAGTAHLADRNQQHLDQPQR